MCTRNTATPTVAAPPSMPLAPPLQMLLAATLPMLLAATLAMLLAATAQATPTQVNVRIEGISKTLFEGPILTEGHYVKAASDTVQRRCDGINPSHPEHLTPGPTPTAASVDAMSLLGETFDAVWYAGFQDYLVTRWGPDHSEGSLAWGVLANNVYTSFGGCQDQLIEGAEVLWVYNAFAFRPLLALYAAGVSTGARPLTATAELNKPFTVEVRAYTSFKEAEPPSQPERKGSVPYEDARVSPVQTTKEKGFQTVLVNDPATVVTDAAGEASITFTTPGWHRLKATGPVLEGEETAVRSNRLDVCVPAEGASDCGAPPPDDQVRQPPPPEGEPEPKEEPKEEPKPKPEEPGKKPVKSPETPPGPGPHAGVASLRFERPHLDGRGAARGLIGVSWQLDETGVGLREWAIAAKSLSERGGKYVTRASGTSGSSALVSLPAGEAYQLQVTVTDVLGRSSTSALGKALVPRDDRVSNLHYKGRWQRVALSGAWLGTVSRGKAGAGMSVRLAAGRPIFLVRGAARKAKVEVLAGSHRKVFTVAAGGGGSRVLTAPGRSRAGTVRLRVLSGTIDLDGYAVEP